ncbi:MAG TPA: hypothetical protein VJS37_12530, partial [Terriglobales bacterium]|nr:hypothetical protein [Terriglobales bacterium]
MRRFKTIVGAGAILLFAGGLFLWWEGRLPERPSNLPKNAIYLETGVVPFKLKSTPGRWVGCWYDSSDQFDHCKVTNQNGWLEFEDVFLPNEGRAAVPESDLIFDTNRTGRLWTGSYEEKITAPVIYLTSGQILLPRKVFDKAKHDLQGR